MTDLFLDFESRSLVDLRKHGSYLYAEHSSTSLVCMAWAVDDGPINLWVPGQVVPCEFLGHVADPRTLFHAWNATFERLMFQHILPANGSWVTPPMPRWRCTMAHAMASGFPGSLAEAGQAMRATSLKDDRGKSLINWWCKPVKGNQFRPVCEDLDVALAAAEYADADAWFEVRRKDKVLKTQAVKEWKTGVFYKYCERDVETERDIYRRLPAWHADELAAWQLDQTINDRGVHVDVEQIQTCIQVSDYCQERLDEELSLATGQAVTGSSQAKRILEWVNTFEGVDLDSVDKLSIEESLKQDLPVEVREVLQLRQAAARLSTRKYEAMLNFSQGKRIRGSHAYYAGHTGRWGGRGVQFQNLPRPEFKRKECEQFVSMLDGKCPSDAAWWLDQFAGGDSEVPGFGAMRAISSMLRSAVIPAAGHKLVVSDFRQIEARVLAWLCGNSKLLKAFANEDSDKNAPDVYKVTAADIFDVPAKAVDSHQRFIGKSAMLGLGYGMGAKKFKDSVFKTTMGKQSLDLDFCQQIIKKFKEANPQVPAVWRNVELAAVEATAKPGTKVAAAKCEFLSNEHLLRVRLPSGRGVFYPFPRLTDGFTPWGDPIKKLSYEGMCFFETGGRKWGRTDTYGGKLVENIVQAVARDLLVAAMLRLEHSGYPLTMSIHDELVSEVPVGFGGADEMERLMSQIPEWAKGCPVACETWEGARYGK